MTVVRQGFAINTDFVVKSTFSQKNIQSLKYSIDGLKQRKRRILKKMRVISQQLRQSEVYDVGKLSQYQSLNDELKRVRIYDAELTHLRNML
jgi:hypothetical protein